MVVGVFFFFFFFFFLNICFELENLSTIFGYHMPALLPYISLLEDLCIFAYPCMATWKICLAGIRSPVAFAESVALGESCGLCN